jgi:hypothetical protein
MAPKAEQPKKPQLKADVANNFLTFYFCVPVKWAIFITVILLIKFLPEWWNLIQVAMPVIANITK